MKTVFKIARTELRILFYSPIAWFLLIVFLVQCGMTYFPFLEYYSRTQEIGGAGARNISNLTYLTFLVNGGLFGSVTQKLYLYIPLLTMGLISRELSSGTIRLLYSSPVKVRTVVLGKYLAMVIYSLLLLAIVGIYMIMGMATIENAQGGIMLSALLGLFLLLCTYSAIGLFMSCLTTYQVVAAVSTFVMFAVLNYIGTVWQGIDFVRDLTYFLSIGGRTEKMLNGLITSKDVIYFLIIIGLFLSFSIYKIRSGMESKTALVKTRTYLALIASALVIGYISSRPALIGYYDTTTFKTRTLTPKVQEIIKEMSGEPLVVNTYVNMLESHQRMGSPEARNEDLGRWEPYIRFKNDIRVNYIQYYDSSEGSYINRMYPGKSIREVAQQWAKASKKDLSDYKSPEEIRKIIDLRPENNRYVMHLSYKGKSTFLRVFDDPNVWPFETEVAAAFKRLLQAKMPKIGFLTGDYERNIHKRGDKEYRALTNLNTFRYSLVNQGFDVDTVSLETQDVPASISALVIADPKQELSVVAIERLQKFIDAGGNVMFIAEPNKQELLNPLLKQFGVQLNPGSVVQESRDFAPDLVTSHLTSFAGTFTRELGIRQADSVTVVMPGTVSLSYTDSGVYAVRPLLLTDKRFTWNRIQKLDLDRITGASATEQESEGTTSGNSGYLTGNEGRRPPVKAGTVRFSPQDGDTRGPLTTAVSLTRQVNGKEQRIIVLGDADIMSNAELQRSNIRTANFVFNTALFSWLTYGEFPVDASRPKPTDNKVTVSTDEVALLSKLLLWVIPGVLIAFGTILLIRRKRK